MSFTQMFSQLSRGDNVHFAKRFPILCLHIILHFKKMFTFTQMFTQMFTFTQIFLSRENDPEGLLWDQI